MKERKEVRRGMKERKEVRRGMKERRGGEKEKGRSRYCCIESRCRVKVLGESNG